MEYMGKVLEEGRLNISEYHSGGCEQMRYLCYLEDHEEFFEFKPDWDKTQDAPPRTVYLIPAVEMPFVHPSPQLQLPFLHSMSEKRAST